MQLERDSLRTGLAGWAMGAAAGALVLNLVWIVTLILLMQLGDTATQVQSRPALYQTSLGAALLLTLLQVPVALGLGLVAWERRPARSLVATALYLLYVPVNVSAYFLAGTLAPRTAGIGEAAAQAALTAVDVGGRFALFGNLPLLGYGLLGLAWILFGSALWGRSRLWTAAALFLVLSGAFSVAGALGTFVDSALLGLGSLVGGVFSLPAFGCLVPGFRALAKPRAG